MLRRCYGNQFVQRLNRSCSCCGDDIDEDGGDEEDEGYAAALMAGSGLLDLPTNEKVVYSSGGYSIPGRMETTTVSSGLIEDDGGQWGVADKRNLQHHDKVGVLRSDVALWSCCSFFQIRVGMIIDAWWWFVIGVVARKQLVNEMGKALTTGTWETVSDISHESWLFMSVASLNLQILWCIFQAEGMDVKKFLGCSWDWAVALLLSQSFKYFFVVSEVVFFFSDS